MKIPILVDERRMRLTAGVEYYLYIGRLLLRKMPSDDILFSALYEAESLVVIVLESTLLPLDRAVVTFTYSSSTRE